MLKPTLIAFLLLGSGLLKAQYEAILNDPDVIWAAEIDLTFWIEPEFTAPDSVDAARNLSTLLKLSNTAVAPGDESNLLLASRVLQLLSDEKLPVFAHPDSLRPLTATERDHILNIKDTVSVIDPETGMESNRLVYNCWWPGSIQLLRLRQLLFYREQSDEFELYTLAFAPLLNRNYGSGSAEQYYRFIPFWFKMPPYRRKDAQKRLAEEPNINWARRMRTGTNMPYLDSLHPFKDFKQPIMQQYLNRLREDPDFKVRTGYDWEVMSAADRESYFNKVDTVVTFDPETYEEKLMVVKKHIKGEEVMKLQLVQDWFWDERRKYPIFQLYAFAPMLEKRDDEGNFRFNTPIFWRLARD